MKNSRKYQYSCFWLNAQQEYLQSKQKFIIEKTADVQKAQSGIEVAQKTKTGPLVIFNSYLTDIS